MSAVVNIYIIFNGFSQLLSRANHQGELTPTSLTEIHNITQNTFPPHTKKLLQKYWIKLNIFTHHRIVFKNTHRHAHTHAHTGIII